MINNDNFSIGKPVIIALVLISLVIGAFSGYYFTSQHYIQKESDELSRDEEVDKKNLICEARVQRGNTGDITSEYFIFERSAEQGDCERFIDYKNVPGDTESIWLGF